MAKEAKKDIFPVFLPQGGCKNNCIFCNQRRITGIDMLPQAEEILRDVENLPKAERELAFYGGSFTGLPKERMKEYLTAGQCLKAAGQIAAMRCSTHPDAIDEETVGLLKAFGMDRVELGVQSLDDDVLSAAGRGHGKKEVFQSIALLHAAGIEVGVQLMLGLPHDSKEKSLAAVGELIPYRPDFVRIYPLLVLEGTGLAKEFRAGKYQPLSLEDAVAWARDLLALFMVHTIPVIRIGLQPAGEIYRGSQAILAGPFHDSFGNLTKAALKLEQMRQVLTKISHRQVRFLAPKDDLPLLFGYQRQNISRLTAENPERIFTVGTDPTLERGTVGVGGITGKKQRESQAVLSQKEFLEEYSKILAGLHCI